MRTGIAFGSNLGDRLRMLREARTRLLAGPLLGPPVLASSVYLTSPVDCPPGSGAFYNAVIEVEFDGDPKLLIDALHTLERAMGRPERAARHAPRPIDLDLLYAGSNVIQQQDLLLPHPRICERRFVLAPLAEIRPELILPGHSQSVADLLKKLDAKDAVEVIGEAW